MSPGGLAPLAQQVWLVAWHLGNLHPYERVLALLLAFGPFVVLAIVIALRRREPDDDDEILGGSAPRSTESD